MGRNGIYYKQELTFALEVMKNGRAPGIDGIPVEFFKAFWSLLGEDLLAVKQYGERLSSF